MTPAEIKNALKDSIQELTDRKSSYTVNPDKHYTRNRKLPFEKVISALLSFRGGSLNNEMLDFFQLDPSVPTSSAFIQQRAKIKPEAFETLFRRFTSKVSENKTYHDLRLLAVDGSDLKSAADPSDPESYFSGTDIQKGYNLLHINAFYDLTQHIYTDAIVQKRRNTDESGALTQMVDRSDIENALLIADRGYESYNNLAHIQNKGWHFLIRIKNAGGGMASGFRLPAGNFDIPFHLKLTRTYTSKEKALCKNRNSYKWLPSNVRFHYLPKEHKKGAPAVFYDLYFRIVRFPVSDTLTETIITNLDAEQFPAEELKRLYAIRWGIETSFRDLKHTLGLLHLHAKKVEFVRQEIYAKLTMYNFCEMITQPVVVQQGQKKYQYKVNFSAAVHICLQFFLGDVPPPRVEVLLKKYISPIRPGRKDFRKLTEKPSVSFTYRIA